ncbi:glucosamine-6-phosphate deaminase [Maritalea sp.]|uniref:glucosamine-6-phosphate deaminase n=1 Tax=Maritalea sp. TaxID=2003361 RepID=UPI003EF1572D
MRLVILPNSDDVAEFACDLFVQQLKQKPQSNLGLATGSSPTALYNKLIERQAAGEVSFSAATSFNLDEYVGLDGDHNQSYRYFMNETLFDHIDIDLKRTFVPNGIAENPNDECKRYEEMIALAGGIDLQLLGIGINGHIGFNEPLSSLASRTRVKTLTKSTIEANSRFFGPDETQPTDSMTMGIGTILNAKQVVLLATGEHKAQAIKGCVEGPVTASCPASALQMHEHAIVVADEAAAKDLTMKDYAIWAERRHQALEKM